MRFTKLRALVPLALAALVLAPGCRRGRQLGISDLDRMAAEHSRYLEELHALQAEFARANPVPQERDFGDDGTLLIWECSLGGRPGREYLRLQFTYVNSSDVTLESARVSLILRDPESGMEWTEVAELSIPYKFALTPNSSYTTSFEMPTRGLHRRPGWEWEIEVEASPAGRP